MSNQKTISKQCEFCNETFETNNPRKKYCKASCKSRAYEQRIGKETPSFLVGNDYDIILKEHNKQSENKEYSNLKIKIESLKEKSMATKAEILKLKSKMSIINNNSIQRYSALGGGLGAYLLMSEVENPLVKGIVTVGSAYFASQITKPNSVKANRQKQELNYLGNKIKKLKEQLKKETEAISRLNLSLIITPEKIEEVVIEEVKIPKRKGFSKKAKKSSPFTTANELTEMEFDLFELDGQLGDFLGKISKNAFITAYGKPGSGKSTFFVQLADFFTKYGMVMYVTPEEGVSPTFKQKLTNQNINSDNIHISAHTSLKEVRKALKTYEYQFCFIDSINMLSDSKPELLEKLRNDYPETLFAIIMQSTKDGKFKGSNEYAHNSDINIQVDAGLAMTIKNRFNELKQYDIFKAF